MDQQEKDWLRIGHDLRNYQPQGDPVADFAAFQELQQTQPNRPRRALLAWLGIGLFLLIFASAWLVTDNGSQEAPLADSPATSAATVVDAAVETLAKAHEREAQASNPQRTVVDAAPATTLNKVPRQVVALTTLTSATKTTTTTTTTDVVFPDAEPVTGAAPDAEAPVRKATRFVSDVAVNRINRLPVTVASPVSLPKVALTEVSTPTQIEQQSRLPRITFGGGLSTHWRGERFLTDVDQGMYISLGLQHALGKRLMLDARVGYRGNNLNLQVFEEDKPWSHYEEKMREIDASSGEEIEYTYLGVVDGYKGIEFSLLLQYQLNNKVVLQGGGRYSLPSLAFRRTVHSSRDGDVTNELTPYHFLANEQPLVRYFDYGVLFGGQYRISNSLSFEAQLNLGMVDLIIDEGERRNRFNHSSSLSLGLRYRLN